MNTAVPTVPPTPPPTPPPTQPPTRPPAPVGPVDPFNCAVDAESTWATDKREWCCRIHHRGCAPTAPPPQPVLPPVVQPYNCDDGFANWQVGLWPRRSGAAECMGRDAPIRVAGV